MRPRKTTLHGIKIPQVVMPPWQITRMNKSRRQWTRMTRPSSSWRMMLPTLVRIPNHSLVVNHLSLDGGAGGIRYTSAPPTTTPSADTARQEQVHRAIFKHPGKVKQLPPLLRTDQAGTSKRPRERDTSNGEPQHKVKRVKVSSFVVTHEAPAPQKQQRNSNALPARRHFPEVSTPFLPVPSISFD